MAKMQKRQSNYQKSTVLAIASFVVVALALVALVIYNGTRHSAASFLAQYSNADHGSTIEEFALQTRGEAYEFTALFNLEGVKLLEYSFNNPEMSGLPPEVSHYLYNVYKKNDLVIVHNHPGIDHTFSDVDMLLTHSDSPFAMQLVFGYSHAYILRPGDKGWPTYGDTQNYLTNIYLRFASGDGEVANQVKTDALSSNLYTTDEFARSYAANFDLRYNIVDLNNFNFADWVP